MKSNAKIRFGTSTTSAPPEMGLMFPGDWRIEPPPDGRYYHAALPQDAIGACIELIEKIRTSTGRWGILEHFKRAFGAGSSSSSEDWAYTDLWTVAEEAARNAPLFIECLYDGCEELRKDSPGWFVPEARHINGVLTKHNVGYRIDPPNLVPLELTGGTIEVEKPSPRFAEQASAVLAKSVARSEELLVSGHPREAVQEILWLLETVSTAFKGLETHSGRVDGKYFNKIVSDLRKLHRGTTLDQVLGWIATMHGYLSSPGGGGVRHGIDLDKIIDLDANEAKLFCNLTRSYISFLIVEHDSLCRPKD